MKKTGASLRDAGLPATPPRLIVYTTSACHLCEQAIYLLHQLGRAVEVLDIVDDEQLLERYGMRIPVVRDAQRAMELDWPFDAEVLQRWLAE